MDGPTSPARPRTTGGAPTLSRGGATPTAVRRHAGVVKLKSSAQPALTFEGTGKTQNGGCMSRRRSRYLLGGATETGTCLGARVQTNAHTRTPLSTCPTIQVRKELHADVCRTRGKTPRLCKHRRRVSQIPSSDGATPAVATVRRARARNHAFTHFRTHPHTHAHTLSHAPTHVHAALRAHSHTTGQVDVDEELESQVQLTQRLLGPWLSVT